MTTPTFNKGWHEEWVRIKGSDIELVTTWFQPNDAMLYLVTFTEEGNALFEELTNKKMDGVFPHLVLPKQKWFHSYGCIVY